jgi:hypothetical protein
MTTFAEKLEAASNPNYGIPTESSPLGYSRTVTSAMAQKPNILTKTTKGYSLTDGTTGAISSPTDEYLSSLGIDPASGVIPGPQDTPWYKNADMLGSIAGLGSAFAQLAALPSQIDYAKTQTKALKQNIATAKEEQNRRNKNISAFNSFNAG